MADISLDFDRLTAVANDAEDLARDFAQIEDATRDFRGLTGNDELENRLHEFAHSWDIARAELRSHLEDLAGYLLRIVQEYSDLDEGRS